MEVDGEENSGRNSQQVLRDLARALLQLEQGIDQRYLSPPIGMYQQFPVSHISYL